jgi:hypothetical protein
LYTEAVAVEADITVVWNPITTPDPIVTVGPAVGVSAAVIGLLYTIVKMAAVAARY